MRREIRSLLDEWNIPLVLITHDPEDVDAFADALAVYRDGMILEQIDDYPARRSSADGALALSGLAGGGVAFEKGAFQAGIIFQGSRRRG